MLSELTGNSLLRKRGDVGGRMMSATAKKSIAIWMTALMVLSAVGLMATASADEGGAQQRISTKGPAWKQGDSWAYDYNGRATDYIILVNFNPGIGSAHMSGTQNSINHYEVTDVSDPTYFRVNHVAEWWENGTYTLTDPNGQTGGPGAYRIHSKMTATPMKLRKADLATAEYNAQWDMTRTYDQTSGGELMDMTYTAAYTYSFPDGPIAWYLFPMDLNKNWQVTGREINHIQETMTYVNAAVSVVFDVTQTTTYTSMLGSTSATYDPQTTPAGVFTDAFKIWLRGGVSWNQQGTATQTGQPPQTVNSNEAGSTEEWQWYSNTAGFIVNWNGTDANHPGELLSAYHYISVPPNFIPLVKTVDGQAYSSSQTIAVEIKEDEKKEIELSVEDDDSQDWINWSVVSVTGAAGNPQGAKLMDTTPVFEQATTTGDIASHIHANKLIIQPKQPKTIDSDTYTIRVNVNDGNDLGSVNLTFNVKVINVNNKPYVNTPIPDIWMRENSTMVCTTWKMTDIFRDQDRDAGISQDRLTYTAVVTAGPPVDVAIDNDTGIVTFNARDYAWDSVPPTGWDATIKFTVTDSGSGIPANKYSNYTNAKLHVQHVNHDPGLSANGTDLEENGLTWNEDIVESSRLDLNKAFSDPDVRYAEDVLKFTYSGQRSIAVKNNAGRITMTPAKDWNGKETIKFKATDIAGRTKELRLDCTVMQVPDAPQFCETEMPILWEDTDALTLKEAATPNGPLNQLALEVSIKDPDELMGAMDPPSCQWWVNDSQGNVVYKTNKFSQGDTDYPFKCTWTGAFSASLSPYEVKCVVKDTFGLTSTYTWNITVLNVNRPPSVRIDSPMDNRTFSKDQKIYFDAWNSSDPDELKDNLTFIWNSSKQGLIKQDRGISGSEFIFKNLRPGKHIITLTILDSDGGETSMSFTVKVSEPATAPGFEFVALIASISVAVVVLGRRRK
jgi:hypothetical protein